MLVKERLPQFSFVEPDYDHSVRGESPGHPVWRSVPGRNRECCDVGSAMAQTSCSSGPTTNGVVGMITSALAAIAPDDVPPVILSANQAPGGFDQYGFRVPAGIVSPFAIRDFVSHRVYDHTSVLATLERKWNLPAMTRRDANALDLFDMVDLKVPPPFLRPPRLHPPANPALTEVCLETGPGTIPPRSAVSIGAVPNTPAIGPATLPAGIVGTPYQASLTASPLGRVTRWSVISGGLPAGLKLDPRTGRISGTPTQTGSSGVTIGVGSGRRPTGVQGYSLAITT